ncbi:unnamed protein product [Caenorhabditis auriculariae]|uniref:Intraflagellar transport protein 20 homolog n=1 Tax=Caenorhabditis auriculariae TaxID=2777116 RepID=A0A8S1GNA6_9PELO|nr:unnamed protein product [Caenorhabditis auriculariae]
MTEQILQKAGLYVDDLNRIRLIDPEVADSLQSTHERATELVGHLKAFQNNTSTLIDSMEEVARVVESEKIRALSSKGAANSGKQRESDAQSLQMLIRERQVELERLRVELAAAQKIEQEQKEQINVFSTV